MNGARTSEGLRGWLPELMIAGALCAGGYLLLLEPAQRELSDAEAALSQRQAAEESQSTRANLPRLSARLEAISRDVSTIELLSGPARDQGELFSRLSALAFEHGVRLDRLSPAAGGAPARPARRAGAKAAPAPEAVVGYELAVVGGYPEMISFIDALQREAGFTRIRQMTATPLMDPGRESVLARIRTEHFAFDPSAVSPEAFAVQPEGMP